jgi:hypothetical protein
MHLRKLATLTQNTASLCNNWINILVFILKTAFFAEKRMKT